MTLRIGFIGFGEVASVFSKALREHGVPVAAYDHNLEREGGAEMLRRRALAQGIEFRSLPELVGSVDYVLSTVNACAAGEVAASCAPYLRRGQVYVDMNSTAPAVKVEMKSTLLASGADFIDSVILEPVSITGNRTKILTCGEKGKEVAEALTRAGLCAAFYSPEVGKASMFKMLRSVFAKGVQALILEMLIAGRRAGIEQDLWRDISDFITQNQFERVAANWIRSYAVNYERLYLEIEQVASAVQELDLDPIMTAGTKAFFHRSRSLGLKEAFPEKPESMDAVVDFLERQLAGADPAVGEPPSN